MDTYHVVDGIEYCAEHGGILTEGTDYHELAGGLGCQYPEHESDRPCRAIPLYTSADSRLSADPNQNQGGSHE